MTHSIQIRLIYALLNSRFLFTGATHLSSSLSKAHRGLVKLSLSHCGLTGKGVAQIGHALVLNKCMASSLQHLDLSSNVAKDDINVRIKVMNPYCELVLNRFLFLHLIDDLQLSRPTECADIFEFIKHRYRT